MRPGTNNAHWRVQVFWPVNLPFLVLYVDPSYRYVLYGEQGRDLGWIYARRPDIPDADYAGLLQALPGPGLRHLQVQEVRPAAGPDRCARVLERGDQALSGQLLRTARASRISISSFSLVVGGAGAAGVSSCLRWTVVTSLTIRNTEAAMIRNCTMVLMKAP